jgi:hypothetical protein
MSEELTIDGENVVCYHQLVIRINQMEDGSVLWNLQPDDVVWEAQKLGLFGLAESGAPLAALGIRALWKLCYDGLVYHALEEACGAQLAVERLLGNRPVDPLLALPMETFSIN